jgi:hypothetical protein
MIVLSQLSIPLDPLFNFFFFFSTFGKRENLTLKEAAAASYTESNFHNFLGSICQDIEVPQQQLGSKQTWLRYLHASCLLACMQRPSATKSQGNQLLTIG